jgi:hypothetical protein
VHYQFIDRFEKELADLTTPNEYKEAKEQMAIRENAEYQKMEKIFKKEFNDVENLSGPGATNAKLCHDKILRVL